MIDSTLRRPILDQIFEARPHLQLNYYSHDSKGIKKICAFVLDYFVLLIPRLIIIATLFTWDKIRNCCCQVRPTDGTEELADPGEIEELNEDVAKELGLSPVPADITEEFADPGEIEGLNEDVAKRLGLNPVPAVQSYSFPHIDRIELLFPKAKHDVLKQILAIPLDQAPEVVSRDGNVVEYAYTSKGRSHRLSFSFDNEGNPTSITINDPKVFVPLLKLRFSAAVPLMGPVLVDNLPNNPLELTLTLLPTEPKDSVSFSIKYAQERTGNVTETFWRIKAKASLKTTTVIKGKILPSSIHFIDGSFTASTTSGIDKLSKFLVNGIKNISSAEITELSFKAEKENVYLTFSGVLISKNDAMAKIPFAPYTITWFYNTSNDWIPVLKKFKWNHSNLSVVPRNQSSAAPSPHVPAATPLPEKALPSSTPSVAISSSNSALSVPADRESLSHIVAPSSQSSAATPEPAPAATPVPEKAARMAPPANKQGVAPSLLKYGFVLTILRKLEKPPSEADIPAIASEIATDPACVLKRNVVLALYEKYKSSQF